MPVIVDEVTGDEQQAVRMLKALGYAVLGQAVSEAALSELRSAFDAYFDEVVGEGDPRRAHRTGPNRYNVWLPLEPPFVDPAIVADPRVLSVFGELLDGDVTCTYYASDTALPGSDYQPIHADERSLFPGLATTLPPSSYVLDIPLVDFRPDNGPLEIWPSTHLIPDDGLIPKESVILGPEDRQTPNQLFAGSMQPVQVLLPAGSLLLRDARMWHRGTPNRSTQRRSMLAIVYSRSWYVTDTLPMSGKLYGSLPESMRQLFRKVTLSRGD